METPIAEGQRIHYNFVKPHLAPAGHTPAQRGGIEMVAKNKWLELLQLALSKGMRRKNIILIGIVIVALGIVLAETGTIYKQISTTHFCLCPANSPCPCATDPNYANGQLITYSVVPDYTFNYLGYFFIAFGSIISLIGITRDGATQSKKGVTSAITKYQPK